MRKIFSIILIIVSFIITALLIRKDTLISKHPLTEISNQTYDYKKEKKMEVDPALDIWKFKLNDEYQKLSKTKTITINFFGKINIKDILLKQISLLGSEIDLEINQINADYKGVFYFDFEKLLLKGNVEIKNINVSANVIINNNAKNKIPYSIHGNLKFNIYIIDNYVYLDFNDSKITISNKTNNISDNKTIVNFLNKIKFKVEGIGKVIKEIRDYYINYLNVPGNLPDTIKEIFNLKLYKGFYVYNFENDKLKSSINDESIYKIFRHLFNEKYDIKLVCNLEHYKVKVFIIDKSKLDYTNNIEFFLDGNIGKINTPKEVIININKSDFKEISNISEIIILKDK